MLIKKKKLTEIYNIEFFNKERETEKNNNNLLFKIIIIILSELKL